MRMYGLPFRIGGLLPCHSLTYLKTIWFMNVKYVNDISGRERLSHPLRFACVWAFSVVAPVVCNSDNSDSLTNVRFSRLFSNLDHVIGLEGGHSARHRLYSGKPHLQAWQRRAYARLLCGGECLSAQVSAMQCQPTQPCIHLRHTACIHSTASSRIHTCLVKQPFNIWASGLEAARVLHTFRAICQQVPGNQSCLLKTDYVEVVTGCLLSATVSCLSQTK